MHGPLCEDGTIQGLLELADLPYVGCCVLASAISMDKDMAKRVARDAGIPIVFYVSLKYEVWKNETQQLAKRIEAEAGYPVFVKPAKPWLKRRGTQGEGTQSAQYGARRCVQI
jgi:D-alanine-D-alanine ligase